MRLMTAETSLLLLEDMLERRGWPFQEKILDDYQRFLCHYVYDNNIDTSAKNTLNLDEELNSVSLVIPLRA